ncbi:hypothetical protein GLYMA_05G198600v4 [Glycine max]|uniref:HIRAN domain-containing protein n=1 Tax=Glycine max TaxID=3847 RepID=A0A0R0K355_SOYBN|nr:hypothetical protein GLYMA_05G198600v4 [Glycine max]
MISFHGNGDDGDGVALLREASNGVLFSVGDRVSLACGNEKGSCGVGNEIEFVVERIDFEECGGEIDGLKTFAGHSQSGKGNKRVFAVTANDPRYEGVVGRARFLQDRCRDILLSNDPVSRILRDESNKVKNLDPKAVADEVPNTVRVLDSVGKDNCNPPSVLDILQGAFIYQLQLHATILRCCSSKPDDGVFMPYQDYPNLVVICRLNHALTIRHFIFPICESFGNNCKRQGIACHHPKLIVLQRKDSIQIVITSANLVEKQGNSSNCGDKFKFWEDRWMGGEVSLIARYPRLYVISSQQNHIIQHMGVFRDKGWEWDFRWRRPLFDNEIDMAVSFLREVEGHRIQPQQGDQWVWKADPSGQYTAKSAYGVLWGEMFEEQQDGVFEELSAEESAAHLFFHCSSNCDFTAQLAGFMASLVIDVPSQAHWITQLTKYDFGGQQDILLLQYLEFTFIELLFCQNLLRLLLQFLGSVVASVVGLSHLFRTVADSNSARLKEFFPRKIVLRRNPIISVDENAVSVLVPNPVQTFEGVRFFRLSITVIISIQNGFLLFGMPDSSRFLDVCPKEALTAALGESCNKVQLFLNLSEMMQPEQIVAFCSLIASIQRCYGLWRLQEINVRLNSFLIWYGSLSNLCGRLPANFQTCKFNGSDVLDVQSWVLNQYRWPESFKSEIIYSASSIGSSANSKFLADFSSSWGCWNASEELKNPSVRIIFPTIERVKNAYNGILPSRYILCFTEVYCGSHNFSAAAWGRQISNPFRTKDDGPKKEDPSVNYGFHICNYELGIIFTFPPTENNGCPEVKSPKLEDITLPFVALREVMVELAEREKEKHTEEEMKDENDEEEYVELPEELEATNYVEQEKEDEKAYADILWSQVDSFQSS